MSEMILRAAKAIQDSVTSSGGLDAVKAAQAVFEAMRNYRGEVEDALDSVPGGFGRAAWIAGLDAALGVQKCP